jgi:hypothetical protein
MSHTIDVPGGTATFVDPNSDEMTPRRTRPIEEITLELGDVLDRVTTARTVAVAAEIADGKTPEQAEAAVDTQPDLIGPDIVLDRRQARLFRELQDAITWAHLLAWDLDRQLPAQPDDLLDLPKDLYLALSVHAAKLSKDARTGSKSFDLSTESLENPASPTGPSGASAARSGGKGRSKTR